MSTFSSFEEYMHEKIRKNQEQNKSQTDVKDHLFKDLVLYFDGYLGPERTMLEWKSLVLEHGAKVLDWLMPEVTHIIAESVTERKVELWKLKRVAVPKWIEDSIEVKKVLPWQKYRPSNWVDSKQTTLTMMTSKPAMRTPPAPIPDHNALTAQHQDPYSYQPPRQAPARTSPTKPNSEFVAKHSSTSEGFLAKYYSSSRLSKISNWKQDLKDFVLAKARERNVDRSHIAQAALQGRRLRTIFHVDMDCFFASVALRNHPELRTQPVVICHSNSASTSSTSEIASCNYVARAANIKNGMFLGKARTLCPNLKVLPYDFEQYDEVSRTLYEILLKHADDVMAISCDEAYLEVSSLINQRGVGELELAERIREEIYRTTGCTASIGIGDNLLAARIATKKAKPNGVYLLKKEDHAVVFGNLPIGELPGVGWVMAKKMQAMRITNCRDILPLSIQLLKKEFGDANGQRLWEFARGIDKRPIENKARQSVGAEVNWGIRFETEPQVVNFLRELTLEVGNRLQKTNAKGKSITLKVKKKLYEGEPFKFLGCGDCLDFSKSSNLDKFTDDVDVIFNECCRMMKELKVPPSELRGIGIHVTKLNEEKIERGQQKLSFTTPVQQASTSYVSASTEPRPVEQPAPATTGPYSFSQIDPTVWVELPESIRAEIEDSLLGIPAQDQEPNVRKRAHSPEPAERSSSKQVKLVHQYIPAVRLPDAPLPDFLGRRDRSQIRVLLTSWLESSEEPNRTDVNYFKGHLRDLIEASYSYEACIYMKYLRREVERVHGDCQTWHNVVKELEEYRRLKDLEISPL